MNELVKKISKIAEKSASEYGLFLIEVNLRGNEKNRIVEVFVDGEMNVSAQDLAELSKLINSEIEAEKIIQSSYRLDVSTPGVERPLKFLKQYPKHLNRRFQIKYQAKDEQLEFKGKLHSVEGDYLVFSTEKDMVKLNFKDILSAKVLISFS